MSSNHKLAHTQPAAPDAHSEEAKGGALSVIVMPAASTSTVQQIHSQPQQATAPLVIQGQQPAAAVRCPPDAGAQKDQGDGDSAASAKLGTVTGSPTVAAAAQVAPDFDLDQIRKAQMHKDLVEINHHSVTDGRSSVFSIGTSDDNATKLGKAIYNCGMKAPDLHRLSQGESIDYGDQSDGGEAQSSSDASISDSATDPAPGAKTDKVDSTHTSELFEGGGRDDKKGKGGSSRGHSSDKSSIESDKEGASSKGRTR